MPDAPAQAALEAEFDTLMARAGISVPTATRASILTAFADLRGQIALLHEPMPYTAEPAHVFRADIP